MAAVIERVRQEDPAAYLRVIARLFRKTSRSTAGLMLDH
jgi:hypothetical protein